MRFLLILLAAVAGAPACFGQQITTDPALLAHQLTNPYQKERDKVEAVYRWVAQHISYRVPPAKKSAGTEKDYYEEFTDTGSVLLPLNDRVARHVLQKKTAVCDGYARLFKCLCDYAGLRCEIVRGYARTYRQRPGKYFRSNHSWNAVMIDSTWQLLDVTWASGYFTEGSNHFVPWFDEFYFLTPPQDFILDHFPEDLQWTLLKNFSLPEEFVNSPFKYAAFSRLNVKQSLPGGGIINCHAGDSIVFEITLPEAPLQFLVSTLPDADTAASAQQHFQVFPEKSGVRAVYTYRPDFFAQRDSHTLGDSHWLYVILNEQVILRYYLNIKHEASHLVETQADSGLLLFWHDN